jgi:hypothetical protein
MTWPEDDMRLWWRQIERGLALMRAPEATPSQRPFSLFIQDLWEESTGGYDGAHIPIALHGASS